MIRSKTIEIELKDPWLHDYEPDMDLKSLMPISPTLKKSDCEHILNKARKDVTFEDALNVLVREMYNRALSEIVIDIYGRNQAFAPAKEMTIEEIEKELGHKIKIVNKEEKE